MGRAVYIGAYSAACALGSNLSEIKANLFADKPPRIGGTSTLAGGRTVPTGALSFDPAATALGISNRSRTNRLLAHALQPLTADVQRAVEKYGSRRVGVVLGTSTSGIAESGDAIADFKRGGVQPHPSVLAKQELFDPVRAALEIVSVAGPAYGVSTACTSGSKAIISAARLISAGLCDAVLCGGVDTLCSLTLNGFAALDALADTVSLPFSRNRSGINIGEAAALFILTAQAGPFRLAGWGESSDAYHISSPDPSGRGAELAVRQAFATAQMTADAVGYVHLHGTGTILNDAMEAGVVNRVFGDQTPCSSTKPMTGHTLGAAGALQAAFCLMALETGKLPPHLWDHEADPALAKVHLTAPGARAQNLRATLSASYAFGGNNTALLLASAQ